MVLLTMFAEKRLCACSYGRRALCLYATRRAQADNITKRFMRFKSHYEVLGVDRNASQAKIKDQFIKLSKEHHPDLSTGSHEKFVRLNEAYKVLSDPTRRNHYDATMRYRTHYDPHGYVHRPPSRPNVYGQQYGGPFKSYEEYPHRDFYERRRQYYRNQADSGVQQIRLLSTIILLISVGLSFHFIAFRPLAYYILSFIYPIRRDGCMKKGKKKKRNK